MFNKITKFYNDHEATILGGLLVGTGIMLLQSNRALAKGTTVDYSEYYRGDDGSLLINIFMKSGRFIPIKVEPLMTQI